MKHVGTQGSFGWEEGPALPYPLGNPQFDQMWSWQPPG